MNIHPHLLDVRLRFHLHRVALVADDTFGVFASLFVTNMSVKQNAIDFAMDYPLAVDAVNRAFYVDDRLTGDDSTEKAIKLQKQCKFVKLEKHCEKKVFC